MEIQDRNEIWVWVDLRSERFFGFCLNVLAAARGMAMSFSGKTAAVLVGSSKKGSEENLPRGQGVISFKSAAERCLRHGADLVYTIDQDNLAIPRPDIYASALSLAVRERSPRLVLLTVTDFGRELAARTARMNHAGLIADCMGMTWKKEGFVATCPSWGGEVAAEISFSDPRKTGFATMQPHAYQAEEKPSDSGVIEQINLEALEIPPKLKLLTSSKASDDIQRLEDADLVVVGGAGLGSAEGFGLARELARAIGGEVGATRPAVLQHWVDEERLIGQTGKTVRPKLLFSIGTSGAIQYTAGIAESERVVAINRDPGSPIFQTADVGIVADAKTFLPIFIEKFRQATMRKLADDLKEEGRGGPQRGFGAKIHKLRETHDLSLEALAEATGQSPEFIEKVENDEITPPVSFLLRFASTLKINPGTFLREDEKTLIRDMRAREFLKRTQNYSYQTLSAGEEKDHLRAFIVTIEPRQTHRPVAYKHEGEEFIFVTAGDLRLTLGQRTHTLKPGESIHFNSDTPHKLKSISDETTRCLVVLYTP